MTEELLNAPADAGSEPVAVEPNPINVDNVDHEAENLAAQEKAKGPEKDDDKAKPAPVEKPKPISAREALEKATKAVEVKETPRTETGQFKGKEGEAQPAEPVATAAKPADATAPAVKEGDTTAPVAKTAAPHDEPPARFSPDAKAAWVTAPDPVKAEVHRAVRELETGIEEHRKRWEPLREYDELARQNQTDIPSALKRYVAMDRLLNEDLGRGLESIVRDKTDGRYGLREVIAQLTGQKPDQAASQQDQTVSELRREIAAMKEQIGGVTGHIKQQTVQSVEQQIAAFAADKPNFEALADKVAEHIRAGKSLEEAYSQAELDAQELAKRLGFIPAAAAPTPAIVPEIAQTDKGTKSIAGAPGAGSAPAAKKPASSISEAVKRAMASAG